MAQHIADPVSVPLFSLLVFSHFIVSDESLLDNCLDMIMMQENSSLKHNETHMAKIRKEVW